MLSRPGTAWMPSVSAGSAGTLVAGNVLGDEARLFDAETLETVPFQDAPQDAISVALSPDGSQLAVATHWTDDQPLRLYDLPSGKLSERQPGGIPANSGLNPLYLHDVDPAFSSDGSRMVAELQRFFPETEWGPSGLTMVWDLADPAEPVSRSGCRRSPSPR